MAGRDRSISRSPGLALALLTLAACAACHAPARTPAAPRAVVLLIGDGMGISQATFSRLLTLDQGKRFAFETLPVVGLVSIYSASNPVTDSGAAATALASGHKTDNQYVGMDASGKPVRSLSEEAAARGWRVGYVTTTTLTHATPAGFYAHVANRYADVAEIAAQLVSHRPDVALGGGLSEFLPVADGGTRQDGRNLVAEAQQSGYTVLRRGDALPSPAPERLLGLFAYGHLAYWLDDQRLPEERRDPSLERLAEMALAVLGRDDQPFFLMIEGGRIDHAAHSFDAGGTAAETREFDRAVAAVIAFQRRRPDTLILVTADHATGGLAINDFVDWEEVRRQRASVDWMAAQIRNAGAGVAMVEEMTGYGDITEADLDAVRQEPDSYDAARNLGRLLAARHNVTWIPRVNSRDTKGHTGEDVPIYAGGPGAERFGGTLDNTDVPKRIAELLGWRLPS